jgi:hypothetical protein
MSIGNENIMIDPIKEFIEPSHSVGVSFCNTKNKNSLEKLY